MISRANSGAHTPAKEPRFPLLSSAFEAGDCSHFGPALQPFQQSLLRFGVSGNCDFFKGQLGGHQIEILTTLTRLVSPSNVHGNWKANQYGICGQLCRQKWPLSDGPKASANVGQLDSPTLTMSRPTAPSWQLKSACDSTSQYSDYLAPHCRSLSQRIRPRQAGEKTLPPGSPKKHANGRQYPQDRRDKRPGMRKPNSRDKSQQSTELIGAPIERDPILNDGVNVLHLHDTK